MTGTTLESLRRLAAAATIAALAAGCASTKIDAQWVDPQLAASPLRGAKVLVACEAYETVLKRICQDRLVDELVARGATPVLAPELANPTPGRTQPDEQYLAAARSNGASAVLATTVSLADTVSGSGMSIGIGGFGIGGGSVRGGVGVSVPVGSAAPSQSYSASSRVVDAASGRLLWSAKATTRPARDLGAQMSELAKTVAGAADKAGLF